MMTVHRNAAGKTPRKTPRKIQPVTTVRVDPAVMNLARERATGDRRVKILDSNTVMIVNGRE